MVKTPARDSFDPQEFLAKVGREKRYRSTEETSHFLPRRSSGYDFLLQKGRVKVVVLSEQGKEAVVGIMETGQFFGEGCMNGHALRIATSDGDGRKFDHIDNQVRDDGGIA